MRRTDASGRGFWAGPGGLDAEGFARWYREEIRSRWTELDMAAVAKAARLLRAARGRGRQVFVMGNGGSAATASHIATDLSKTAAAPGKPLLRCLSLTDNVPFITAVGNDMGFDRVFERQLENLLRRGDIVILVTGSGNSPNLLRACVLARRRGAVTVGLLGFDGGKLRTRVDVPLVVRSSQYGVIEDVHMSVGHILAFYLRQERA